MAKKKIAVMVLHGMGNQGEKVPADSSQPTYSKKLYKALRREFGGAAFDQDIAWREVRYSHITQTNQDIFFKKIKRRVSYDWARELIIKYLGDVAAYRHSPNDDNTSIYTNVHKEVSKTIGQLKRDTADNAPLVILAHSLGGHVISNYIYDCQSAAPVKADMANLNTVAALVTFGCNIPLFTFGWPSKHIKAIKDPGTGLPKHLRIKDWWRNYYDKDDVFGYPLAKTGVGYEKLEKSGELKDIKIDAGWFGASMTPYSHALYWGDVDLIRPISILLKKFAKIT